MVLLGTLNNPRAAQAFIDYLSLSKIDCQLKKQHNQWQIWLITTDQLEMVNIEFNQFLSSPDDKKYQAASWQSANPQIELTHDKSANLSLLVNFISHAGPVTLIIFAISVFVYLTYMLGVPTLYQGLSFFNPFVPTNLIEIWRLFTPALLHFSALHIIFNLLWWWYLGGQIENKISSVKLLLLFILASSLPNILQYYISGPAFGGLSGVVYALVGYFWWMGRLSPQSGLFLPPAYIGFMLIWLVLGFFDFLGIQVANGAHLGGLLTGCALAWLDHKKIVNSN